MPGPVFARGDRVALRTIDEDDLEFVQRGRNDPTIRAPLTDNVPKNDKQIRDYYENQISDDETVNLLVCADVEDADADEDADGTPNETTDSEPFATPVGTVNIGWVRQPHGVGFLMYWIAPEHRGNGYVTEGTELLLDHAFRDRRLAKIAAHVLATNPASQSVLEKLGFTREGIARQECFVDGERVDMYHYGLLAEEWLGRDE